MVELSVRNIRLTLNVTDLKLCVKSRVMLNGHKRQGIKLHCSGMERKTANANLQVKSEPQNIRHVKQILKI